MTNSNLISSKEPPYTFENLWNWLGDREVFFCEASQNLFTNSCKKMLECFEILHYVDGCVFWKLKFNPRSLGLHDPMGQLYDFHSEMGNDNVGLFATHNTEGEIDVVENWLKVPLNWWKENKNRPDIRKYCEEVLSGQKTF